MRLQKYLAECGVASRRESEKIIQAGRVKVNHDIVLHPGTPIDPDRDIVLLDENPVALYTNKVYILFYKPPKVVTTVKDQFGRACVMDYFQDLPMRIFPVGRLDYDTEGLLLLTNDGDFMYQMTHPSHEIDKTYIAEVEGNLDDTAVTKMRQGILIDGRMTRGAKVTQLGSQLVQIVIHEGRNRQVRRICEAAGHPVKTLKRIAIGALKLDLELPGSWRELSAEEIKKIL